MNCLTNDPETAKALRRAYVQYVKVLRRADAQYAKAREAAKALPRAQKVIALRDAKQALHLAYEQARTAGVA